MSLFRTKEWWKTRCGAKESFDRHSLLVVALFGEDRKDILIVGSQNGYLRMYSPSSQWLDESKSPSNYRATDMLIETQLGDCIVDVKAGKFVSGSQDICLAVLTESKLMVFNVGLVEGSTEYGDQCELKLAYEHVLPKFPASLTIGPFGGVRGRDFLCVQCLDGTLLFYEQEIFTFSQTLRNRLLPEPIVYVARYDVFVTSSSAWFIDCYRYQSMAERSRSNDRAVSLALEPDWDYNIGEPVVDIEAVTLSSYEMGIVVLGLRHLYCLKDNCSSVKFAKRFGYRPVCFLPYVLEPDGRLLVLAIADTCTLLIYEGTALKWSAQLPFLPVAVARVELQHLQGGIALLSEDGQLEVCYLGSEPSRFVVPPVHPRGYDYAAAEQELADLRATLKESKRSGSSDRTNEAGAETELIVSVVAKLGMEEPISFVTIELSSYARLDDVQVCVDVTEPLISSKTFYSVSNLCERHSTEIQVRLDGEWPPISGEVRVTVSYRTDTGNLRALRRTAQVPLKAMLRGCVPETVSTFAAIIKSPDSLPTPAQTFPEFNGDEWQKTGSNVLGLRHANSDRTVTLVLSNNGNRYRVQASDGLSTILAVERLVQKLVEKGKGGAKTNVGPNVLQLVQQRTEAHVAARREVDRIQDEIALLTRQLRNIERKLLRTVRERNERSLSTTGLPFLFESTCQAIFAQLQDLVAAETERDRLAHELRCSLRLLLLLLRPNMSKEKHAALEAAIGFRSRPCDRLDWEEIASATLTVLLKPMSRKAGAPEAKSSNWSALVPIANSRDLAKLKKRLTHAIERLGGAEESDIAEVESIGDDGLVSA